MAEETTDNKDSKEVQADHIPSLDEVTELNQHKIEKDDSKDDSSTKQPEDKDDKTESTSDEQPAVDEISEERQTAPELPEIVEPEEVDSEITKQAKNKVPIKSFDGKTYYFNNLDEVPDDFEPASYKQLMVGVDALRDKAETDRKTVADAEKAAEKAELKKRTDAMQVSWDKDIKDLGINEKDAEAVYDYMETSLKAGIPIDNFSTAYKAMKYESMQEDHDKELTDKKKQRGARVQSGGSGGGDKPIEKIAPPPGVSLDQVHQRALRELS